MRKFVYVLVFLVLSCDWYHIDELIDNNDVDKIKYILENKKIDVNHQDKNGGTYLLKALAGGRYEIAKLLVEHGSNITIADDIGLTPLKIILKGDNIEIIKFFIDHGINLNESIQFHKDMDILPVQYYLVVQDNIEILKLLLDNGADINCYDKDGNNLLVYSLKNISKDVPEVIEYLIIKGLDYNHKNNKGQSVLDIAKEKNIDNKKQKSVEMLIKYGAK